MIELHERELVFQFPDVHPDAVCRIDFRRTLRLPNNDRTYPLPPGLGRFPLLHVEDYAAKLPSAWAAHGGVMLPMFQADALWINFSSSFKEGYPFAVQIAVGRINALSGERWRNELSSLTQDYLVAPDQPWLDGFCLRKGLTRQFVARPLGESRMASEPDGDDAIFDGLQIAVYPMKRERYQALADRRLTDGFAIDFSGDEPIGQQPAHLLQGNVYVDEYGCEAWDQQAVSRCFVHMLNSEQWTRATGRPMPGNAPTAAAYQEAGLPWCACYQEPKKVMLPGLGILANLDEMPLEATRDVESRPLANDSARPSKAVSMGLKPERADQGYR